MMEKNPLVINPGIITSEERFLGSFARSQNELSTSARETKTRYSITVRRVWKTRTVVARSLGGTVAGG